MAESKMTAAKARRLAEVCTAMAEACETCERLEPLGPHLGTTRRMELEMARARRQTCTETLRREVGRG